MYINFELLYSKGFTDADLILLQKIKQKEMLPENSDITKFKNNDLIAFLKEGELRISKKGNILLEDLQIPYYTDDVKEVVERSIEMYTNYSKPIGNKSDVKSRASWFMAETGFSVEVIIAEIENYLSTTSIEFIAKLDNLFWRQPSVYSTHKSIKDSKLYDIISTKYKLNTDYFLETKNKELKWLSAVASLEPAQKSIYFTTLDGDKKRIAEFRDHLNKLITKWSIT